MENLKVKSMTKSKHTIPNAHIMSADWNMIINMMKYKAKKHNDTLVFVNPAYTSQICYYCHTFCGKHPVSERSWNCKNSNCPFASKNNPVDRDICSAKYILQLALGQVPVSVYKQIPSCKRISTPRLRKKFLKVSIYNQRTVICAVREDSLQTLISLEQTRSKGWNSPQYIVK